MIRTGARSTATRDYAAFLPVEAEVPEPTATWFSWRGREVHVARLVRPSAAVRVVGVHGGGAHGGALWPFVATAGVDAEVLLCDLPLYGRTREPDPHAVRYGDWVALLVDLLRHERTVDPRPLVLLGASMGGMLAYEAAARSGVVSHVVATCLLDPRDPEARAAAARLAPLGRHAPLLLAPARTGPLARVRVPVGLLTDLRLMSKDPDLSRTCATDPLGGATRVPLGFVASWFGHAGTPPESFAACPITLTHPAEDAWTPLRLSARFLDGVTQVPTRVVELESCGHFPIEQPGYDTLVRTVRGVVAEVGR